MPNICDYEGSDYKARFWQNADRAYEDGVERVALKKLLPTTGERMAEFGAAFGRLADLYAGYREVLLLDYSRSLLEEAARVWGADSRFKFVVADIYNSPLAPGVLSAATMVRVIHHIADVPAALAQIRRALAPGATFVLEFANKRNAKAIARHAARRQAWSPHALEPVEFVKLNFDFHPTWMARALAAAGFVVKRTLPVSYLRVGAMKRAVSTATMVKIDAALQRTSSLGLWSPSVFVECVASGSGAAPSPVSPDHIFVSPRSGQPLRREGDVLVCDGDGTRWRADGNVFDFKQPLS